MWRGYKGGLIRGVFGVVTLILSLILANITANAYSEEFTGELEPFVGGVVESTLHEIVEDDISYTYEDSEFESDDFHTAFTILREVGFPEAAAAHVAKLAAEDDSEDRLLTDHIADNLSSIMSFVAVFGIAFTLLAIIFAVIGNLIGFVFSLPGLQLVDIIAGVVFGFVKGFILVLTIGAVVRYYGMLSISTVENTTFLNYIINHNLVANVLGI